MVRHFKNKEAYHKFKAYVHMHNIPTNPDEKYVYIAGKRHYMKRTKSKSKRKKIDFKF